MKKDSRGEESTDLILRIQRVEGSIKGRIVIVLFYNSSS